MSRFLSLSIFVLAVIALGSNAAAVATAETYPEVIPGPDLPSLASLNLTSADLYKMDYKALLSRRDPNPLLEKRFQLNCKGRKCQAVDAAACVSYLASLGNKLCKVGANPLHERVFCRSGSARLIVHKTTSNTVSTCNDIARAGGDIMDKCTKFGLTAGQAAAHGNGNYIVDIAFVGT